jgi:peptidoglycan/xylan/chitin deacetylase (PgdA/CDA1 family)
LIALLPLIAHAQRVALTFDDGLNPQKTPDAAGWNHAILGALAEAGVKSILFAAGEQVDSPLGMALVRDWGRAGHGVANHTYSHLDLGSEAVTLEQYIADTQRDAALLSGVPGWTLRFRFPYLKEGDSDWYYDQRYAAWRASHPQADPAPFRQAYLDHLWGRATYYDSLARKLLGRSADHVLLLHTRRINAEFLPSIIAMFHARGWTIIPPRQAYRDPLYAMQPATLPAGESVLWALAKQAGMPGLRYPAEDDVYEKPILDRLGL